MPIVHRAVFATPTPLAAATPVTENSATASAATNATTPTYSPLLCPASSRGPRRQVMRRSWRRGDAEHRVPGPHATTRRAQSTDLLPFSLDVVYLDIKTVRGREPAWTLTTGAPGSVGKMGGSEPETSRGDG